MASLLTPIVLKFPDRGSCAVDYIDYFDEGQYGPDKAFFVGRYQKLEDIAAQMNKCLALQTNLGSMIHVNRCDIPDKWTTYFVDAEKADHPRRAQYKIRFLLRIKFYGDYAYVDLGVKWKKDEDLDTIEPIIITPDQLEVVNRCWISEADAKYILEELKNATASASTEKLLSFTETQIYDATQDSVREMTDEEKTALDEVKALSNANLLTDGESIFTDAEGNSIGL